MSSFDLIVIGAGIHGAAVAREAAARGLSVAVLEQFDRPAQATSSKSSKLIHGGLRYLESHQFHLVYECLREQQILLRTAPHLVQRREFAIPVVPHAKRPAWLIQCGLYLYWLLGGAKPQRLPLVTAEADGLRSKQFDALLSYEDAQTDDVALTQAVLRSAETMGAHVELAASCESIVLAQETVAVSFRRQDALIEWRARAVVNASGPWVNEVIARVSPPIAHHAIEWVRGTHIELPGALSRCYYVEAPDGRAVFILPWRGHRLVGTTERVHRDRIEECHATEEEMLYLLETYNRYFAPACLPSQLINAWAGLRVLPAAKQSPFARARDAIVVNSRPVRPQVVSIYGGKLTSHRATAERVLKQLSWLGGKPTYDTRTQLLPLSESD